MASSSNRHWPSMFKSKPSKTHHQWQHGINQSLLSSGCLRTPYSSIGGGFEERSPEPKPRWNPRPEQIRILEAIFNSGTVNPPRDEIRKIRAQLQEFGQVGDANVFYWFQNRKSRSKHKLRHHISSKPANNKHSNKTNTPTNNNNNNVIDTTTNNSTSGNNFSVVVQDEYPIIVDNFEFQSSSSSGQGLLLGEDITGDHIGATVMTHGSAIAPLVDVAPISPGIGQLHEEGAVGTEGSESKSTVFINDVAFEVPVGPFNVREAFGAEAVLINSYGHPILTNEWGLTLHSLHHGAFYYLV